MGRQAIDVIGDYGVGLEQDHISSALVSIDFAHHKIHEGEHYSYCNSVALSLTDSYTIGFQTPASTSYCHFLWSGYAIGPASGILLEDCTLTAIASTAAFNSNRNSANLPAMAMYLSCTAGTGSAATGSVIDRWRIGSNGGGAISPQGGQVTREDEFILKGNTKYAIKLFSNMNSNTIDYCFTWYEE